MKCHYIYDPEVGKVLIPGCCGSAVYGIHRCTCRQTGPPEPRDELIKELEGENARLNRLIKNLLKSKKIKMLAQEPPTLTIAEALAAGYTQCVQQDNCYAEPIAEVEPSELDRVDYWVVAKESRPFQISSDCLRQMVVDHVMDQVEVADEDGELGELVEEMTLDEFVALTDRINAKLAEKEWYPSAGIRLVAD